MAATKYVSKACKAHVLLLLETVGPLVLQHLGWVPREGGDGGKAQSHVATLWTSVVLIATASSCIYAGSWRSVRPKPGEGEKVDDEDKPVSMTAGDAMRFPLVGSAVLLGLFTAIKLLPASMISLVVGWYFVLLGTFAIAATALPFVPFGNTRGFLKLGFLNKLPKIVKLFLFEAEDVGALEVTLAELICGLGSFGFCCWYHASRHWVSNNVIGIGFCVQGIEMLSLGSVQVGMILLSGLFFYDIFWVFFTPVMVTVAKSFDAPIKLLFLRSLSASVAGETGQAPKPQFSMLGLGDIVIPGIYLALLLRMDHKRGFDKSNYFGFVFVSYILGLVATLVVMNVFNHAQPALLYLVPACLGATFLMAMKRKEVKFIFNWSEEEEEEDAKKDK
mmetsp:Transcript_10901/g.24844  ORF Transcript_10901/g.24844 Transcript_10901/m.24844 type:complete len:390 (-) Transcript_10901:213-1382(-)